MILIGMGANLSGRWGTPEETLDKAIRAIEQAGISIVSRSQFFVSSPLGKGGQGVYVNSALRAASHLPPAALLQRLHGIERQAGRRRGVRWRSRELDLDLLDWHGIILKRAKLPVRSGFIPLILPHPGIARRPFVLAPLLEIAPRWHHPVTGRTPLQMLKALPTSAEGRILGR